MAKETTKATLRFWNESAEGYSEGVKRELDDREASDAWVRKSLENAPDKARLRILDVGTGPGFFTISFAKLGHDVTGIDISPEMVRVAKENAAEQGMSCDFRVMNANTLDFPDDTFDLIISRVVTWTLPDLYDCYKEWRRVLAPHGRLIVFDANHYINHLDEEEARIMRLNMRRMMLEGTEPTDHFDFHVRWKYWEEDVPNIGIDRPRYDRSLLLKLRFVDIVAVENVFPGKYRETGTSTPTFMVRAEKPSEDEESNFIVNEYWNAIAGCVSARAAKRIADGSAEATAKAISEHIPKGSRVLDVGVGSGAIAIPLAKLGYDVSGVDRASAMIEMARLTAEENGAPLDLAVADGEHLPCDGESYDAVLLRNVVWNSYHPQRMICEAARVLKKGGALIIADGNWWSDIAEWE